MIATGNASKYRLAAAGSPPLTVTARGTERVRYVATAEPTIAIQIIA
jgi:hypothetical protein